MLSIYGRKLASATSKSGTTAVLHSGPEELEEVTDGDRENFLGSVSGGGLRVLEVRIFSRDSSLFFLFS